MRTTSERAARLLLSLLIVGTWILVALVTIPRAISRGVADYGFFTGVSERLRAGDVLYVQVWDNKDPLVFYSLAIARTIGPNGVIGAWGLEILWVVAAATALYVIARFQRVSRPLAAYIGFGLGPLVILGVAYFMGSTHLPAITLTLVAVACLYARHPVVAGISVGLIIFIKLVMAPMAIVVAVVTLLVLKRRTDLRWFVLGMGVVVVAMGVVLLVRGELAGFVETQIHNVLYSQSPIVTAEQSGLVQKIAQHIVILVNPQVAAIEFTTAAILAVTAPWWSRSKMQRTTTTPLWWITVSGTVVAVAVIGVTGKWFHHAQALYIPAALSLVLLAAWLISSTGIRALLIAGLCALVTYPLAGLPQPGLYSDAFTELPNRWGQATSTDTLTSILRDRDPASASFIGETVPQSSGLEEWSVACRHIAQRPFNPEEVFDETIDCLPSSEVVVVSQNLDTTSNFPAYDAFLEGVGAILDEGYVCEETAGFLICESRERV